MILLTTFFNSFDASSVHAMPQNPAYIVSSLSFGAEPCCLRCSDFSISFILQNILSQVKRQQRSFSEITEMNRQDQLQLDSEHLLPISLWCESNLWTPERVTQYGCHGAALSGTISPSRVIKCALRRRDALIHPVTRRPAEETSSRSSFLPHSQLTQTNKQINT